MKRSKYIRLSVALLMAGSGLFLTNCKKDTKDPEPAPVVTPKQRNTERLTGKNFKLVSLTVQPGLFGGETDLYSQMPDCEKDNIFRYDTPNIFKQDEGAAKCDTNAPQTETGTWVWNTDETIITTVFKGETVSYKVLTNDGNTLKVKYTENVQGTNYTATATFVKQ